jgi:pilus assembly protein CpaE
MTAGNGAGTEEALSERRTEAGQSLKAILICPDATLADQFLATARTLPNLAIVMQVDHYPSPIELAEKIRQIRSDVVLIDVGSDRARALELIAPVIASGPHVSATGLNRSNDSEAILQWLRSGGTEYFSSPFSQSDLAHAVERTLLRRTVEASTESAAPPGRLFAFAPVKGGAGATTIAMNVACQFHKAGRRVLLVDFNLFAGVVSFLLRARHPYNATDALKHSGELDAALWGSLVADHGGMDILLAPEQPPPAAIDPYPVQQVLEYARSRYDYVVVDLGSIFEPVSLAALPVTHIIHLVCGSDPSSLFMMRRTVPLVEGFGYGREQLRVLVNRVERRAEISTADMEKIFRAPVHTSFPDDPQGVAQALRDGVPLADNSNLGKSVGKYAAGLLHGGQTALRSSGVKALKEILSGT